MRVICGRDETRTRLAASELGWDASETDWRRVIERDDVDIVDICTPADLHMDITIAALDAGKHVICEKPMGNSVAEAELMSRAAAAASSRGVKSMIAFDHRRLPALAHASRMVEEGSLGSIRHVRGLYLQDWLVEAPNPFVSRGEKAVSGCLADIGSHILDIAEFVSGLRFESVSASLHTFVDGKSVIDGSASRGAVVREEATQRGVDDAALVHARMSGGALGAIEASRFALGRKNAMRLEVNGSLGSLAFDLDSPGELQIFDAADASAGSGFRRIQIEEHDDHDVEGWPPGGNRLGGGSALVNGLRDFLDDIVWGRAPRSTFLNGLHLQRVVDAVERSSENGSAWTPVDRSPTRPTRTTH
jgi:predicted dehydrogenase